METKARKAIKISSNRLSLLLRIILLLSLIPLFTACVPPVVPEFSGQVPKKITTTEQVQQAITLALAEEGWSITAVQHHGVITASKKQQDQIASVYIVYGYQGYSMEYADSQQMNYNKHNNTIDPIYRKWVYSLNAAINYQLVQTAKAV